MLTKAEIDRRQRRAENKRLGRTTPQCILIKVDQYRHFTYRGHCYVCGWFSGKVRLEFGQAKADNAGHRAKKVGCRSL